MNEPIKPGDLVMVVKNLGPSVYDKLLGTIATVVTGPKPMRYQVDGNVYQIYTLSVHQDIGFSNEELKKIPPLDEPETVKRHDEVPA